MPRENISALTALTAVADGDMLQVRDASAAAVNKSVTVAALRETMRGGIVTITAASDALTRTEHAGRTIVLSASGGIDLTLPEATGSGDVYSFVVGVATADAYTIATADPSNCDICGNIVGSNDSDATTVLYRDTDATSLSFGGTSQARGGSLGDWFELVDIATDLWQLRGAITQGGTEATPIIA